MSHLFEISCHIVEQLEKLNPDCSINCGTFDVESTVTEGTFRLVCCSELSGSRDFGLLNFLEADQRHNSFFVVAVVMRFSWVSTLQSASRRVFDVLWVLEYWHLLSKFQCITSFELRAASPVGVFVNVQQDLEHPTFTSSPLGFRISPTCPRSPLHQTFVRLSSDSHQTLVSLSISTSFFRNLQSDFLDIYKSLRVPIYRKISTFTRMSENSEHPLFISSSEFPHSVPSSDLLLGSYSCNFEGISTLSLSCLSQSFIHPDLSSALISFCKYFELANTNKSNQTPNRNSSNVRYWRLEVRKTSGM